MSQLSSRFALSNALLRLPSSYAAAGRTPKKDFKTPMSFRPPRRLYLMRSAFVTTRKLEKQHDSINRQEDSRNRREPRGGTASCGSGHRKRGASARGGTDKRLRFDN